jgi:hypothetical protein
MNTTTASLITETNQQENTQVAGLPRSPIPWILAWGVYSLLALGYLGYQSAWLTTMCITK